MLHAMVMSYDMAMLLGVAMLHDIVIRVLITHQYYGYRNTLSFCIVLKRPPQHSLLLLSHSLLMLYLESILLIPSYAVILHCFETFTLTFAVTHTLFSSHGVLRTSASSCRVNAGVLMSNVQELIKMEYKHLKFVRPLV